MQIFENQGATVLPMARRASMTMMIQRKHLALQEYTKTARQPTMRGGMSSNTIIPMMRETTLEVSQSVWTRELTVSQKPIMKSEQNRAKRRKKIRARMSWFLVLRFTVLYSSLNRPSRIDCLTLSCFFFLTRKQSRIGKMMTTLRIAAYTPSQKSRIAF